MTEPATAQVEREPLVVGRYALFDALASGGMATVHLGRLLGAVGFGRTVAVKRLHAHFASDPELVTMFMDEARIVSRIVHPNVVPMIDVIESSKGLLLVMEYVHGEALSKLLRATRAQREAVPLEIIGAVLHGALLGLHAAHETRGANGELLGVVHRDVSPQNVMVGADGVARVLDFGVAKAVGRAQVTREGQIKGKLSYMAPEQIRGKVDRRADVFAAAVILWEALAGRRFHDGAKDVEIITRVVKGAFPPPSKVRPDVSPELDAVVLRGLAVDPDERYASAREMAIDLERTTGLASPSLVGEWVERLAKDALEERAGKIAAMEQASGALVPVESRPPPPGGEPGQDRRTPPGGGGVAAGSASSAMHPAAVGATSSSVSASTSVVSSITESSASRGTPMGTELPAQPAQPRDLAPTIAVISFCVALALVGIVLGVYSLYGRSPARDPAPAVSGALADSASGVQPPPPPSASDAPSPASSARPDGEEGRVHADRDASSDELDAGSIAPPRTASPAVHPARPPVTAPPKKACSPYVIDDAGRRRYNLDCMGD